MDRLKKNKTLDKINAEIKHLRKWGKINRINAIKAEIYISLWKDIRLEFYKVPVCDDP